MTTIFDKVNPTATTVSAAVLVCTTASAWLVLRSWTRKAKCPNADVSDDPTKQGFSMRKVPSNLDVIVIGSGIGGLSTAALLAKEGKKVLVLEQHDVAGGNLHTFTEKGYEFDTGLHYIGGKIGHKNASFRKLLNYISDEEIEWEPMDDAYDIAISGNEKYSFYSSWTKLKKELKSSFPDEAKDIDKYFASVLHVAGVFPLWMLLKLVPESIYNLLMWAFAKQMSIFQKTTSQVLESITNNKKLRGVLAYHYGDYGKLIGAKNVLCP